MKICLSVSGIYSVSYNFSATKQDSCESNIQQDKDVVKGRKSGELSVSQTNTNIQNEMNPEHTLPQQDPDHINIENQHTDFTAKAEMNSNDDTTENQATPNIHSGAAEDNIQSTEMHHPDFSSHLIIDKQQPSQRRGIVLWISNCNVQYCDNQCDICNSCVVLMYSSESL